MRTNLARSLIWVIVPLVFLLACGEDEETKRTYKIALGNDWAPYDVGVKKGLNYDILTALCAANAEMECEIVDAPYSACFDSDADGNAILGSDVAAGKYDGCMGWYITDARKALGAKFSNDYSLGLPGSLIMLSTGTAPTGTDLGGAKVGIIAGFWIDAACLEKHYSNFSAEVLADKDAVLAAVKDGTITYAFWDSAAPLDPPDGTMFVGDPIGDCPDEGIALAAFGDKADDLLADFNKGLASIRADGSLKQICTDAITKYGLGDPNCILQ